MKCPKQYNIVQKIQERNIFNNDDINTGFDRTFMEIQEFKDCYKEDCAFWNKEKERCGDK